MSSKTFKEQSHHLIICPGLNYKGPVKTLTEHWFKKWAEKGIYCHVYNPKWEDHKHFQPILNDLENLIDTYTQQGVVSLLGFSAGASAVGNAAITKKKQVNKVIFICGRLKKGGPGMRSLEVATEDRPAFKESVLKFEGQQHSLTKADRHKFLIFQSLVDEVVPDSTSYLDGAHQVRVYSVEHLLSILISLSLLSGKIIRFIDQ